MAEKTEWQLKVEAAQRLFEFHNTTAQGAKNLGDEKRYRDHINRAMKFLDVKERLVNNPEADIDPDLLKEMGW